MAGRNEGPGRTLAGKLTLGLYNCYDPKQWHDISRKIGWRFGQGSLRLPGPGKDCFGGATGEPT
ncbi:MAG TPA: hypothetical protein VM286_03945 [Candidatus Thermoplasmatota archaeon]|nr:hypothetical protein [Candidatus Thermoplasmatota archaeon]